MFEADEARVLLKSTDTTSLLGLRDRALIGLPLTPITGARTGIARALEDDNRDPSPSKRAPYI